MPPKSLHIFGVLTFITALFSSMRDLPKMEMSQSHRAITDGGVAHSEQEKLDGDQDREKLDGDQDRSIDPPPLIWWVNLVTDRMNYSLLMKILAHPKQSPSLQELVYLYPDKGQTTIVEALEELVEWGILERLVIPTGKRSRSLPYVFYQISEPGYKLLQALGIVINEEDLQHWYSDLPKPEQINRYEEAPRDAAVVESENVDKSKRDGLEEVVSNLQIVKKDPSVFDQAVGFIKEKLGISGKGLKEQRKLRVRYFG